ncbi:hypothetical protein [Aliikangiella coralliicola]|uniref:Uncharacterized protein n=1 Tax=Aliikangiella coralliicola TaxID=2592383 RepID=A0A545UFQ5_9GAMM|nr:hypothetical protein [Aliikangiella coralliicola]TQV88302.1 hypothetical protein FLL46_07180 [Aliikangiella coralliicola]
MITIATIDQQLSQQSRFCLIDWLLTDNFIDYSEYEAWRYEKNELLIDAIQLNQEALRNLLADTERHCRSLGLVSEPQEYFSWTNEKRKILSASHNSQQNSQLTQCWLRPQDQPQLDLFMDNTAQLVEHELLQYLEARQFSLAQNILKKLSELNAECPRLGGYQDLINYGLHMQANEQIDSEMLAAELTGLKTEVMPLAVEVLGQSTRDYLSFAWRRLANNMVNVNFDPAQPELHASFALLEIPDYRSAVTGLLADTNLYQQPILLERLARSYLALHQDDNAMIVICLLMEADGDYAEDLLDDLKSYDIHRQWQDFWEENDAWPREHFPAYLMIKKPALIHQLDNFPPMMNPVTNAMTDLIKLKLNQEDEIPARKAMLELSKDLLYVYLDS